MTEDLTTLNKQAITAAKQHMGEVAWPTVALTFATVVSFVLTLALFMAGALPVWAATLLIGALTYFSYTPLHEAVHNNIHGEHDQLTWLNHLCGYLVAPLIAVPYQSHRLEHFTHHRYTNQPDKDPDFLISGMGKGPFSALLTVLRFLWVQNTFFARQHWGSASRREKVIYCTELFVSIGWRILFLSLVSQSGAMAVVLVGYLIGGAFTAYWFAYRPHLPYKEPKRYRNTNSLIMPAYMKPVEWFWLGQNLHSIHHLFPRVPFYRYHALHREIEPVLRAHGTPIIGIFNRHPQ
ncbi:MULTISPECIES: fatty acid desaturase family protein [unclassified Marinobacter]|uniref:Fatty acid desaturase domain-containing protein n=1 Tax=Marinobacter nauticus TaxID=2743 RepID=A0A455W341_MARNT|nr:MULTISPECIES: fatty acid desaturase [unclassified Marinobacter]QFS86679.1 Fatty acid desaturase [Marinobacter sp. THAF197a]QFT50463.1 Fatty acid desaturase [Marinobacter sp. THAF39]BBJ03559.1 hypothetical protein YBY_14070 [Marinobacter nauticus]